MLRTSGISEDGTAEDALTLQMLRKGSQIKSYCSLEYDSLEVLQMRERGQVSVLAHNHV